MLCRNSVQIYVVEAAAVAQEVVSYKEGGNIIIFLQHMWEKLLDLPQFIMAWKHYEILFIHVSSEGLGAGGSINIFVSFYWLSLGNATCGLFLKL